MTEKEREALDCIPICEIEDYLKRRKKRIELSTRPKESEKLDTLELLVEEYLRDSGIVKEGVRYDYLKEAIIVSTKMDCRKKILNEVYSKLSDTYGVPESHIQRAISIKVREVDSKMTPSIFIRKAVKAIEPLM